MAGPFKMKGMSFGNSPMHQDKGKQKLTEKKTEKFRLSSSTNAKTGETKYYKVVSTGKKDSEGFTIMKNVEITKAQHDSYKGNK